MSLTKKEAISWHRRMWIWIAKQIAKHRKVMDIVELKTQFCDMFNVHPDRYCFCCEYDNNWCKSCPVVWKNENYVECSFCMDSEYEQCVLLYEGDEHNNNNWKKQAKIAYRIAMLPERENL